MIIEKTPTGNRPDRRTNAPARASVTLEKPAAAPPTKKRGRASKGNKRSDRNAARNSAKGVETMYRNAYRAELDIIALAATKANIMISLNGFIISALMISGGFIYASSPLLLLPAALFLFTSALSVYFALLAASPEQVGTVGRVASWLGAVIRRQAGFRDFGTYVRRERRFVEGESNILIYEDRVKLSKVDYRERMRALRDNPDGVYDGMSDQLYWLGQMSSTKFRMLGSSYGVFRWGLVLTVLSFLAIKAYASVPHLLEEIRGGVRSVPLRNVVVSRFEDIYEPSAAAQLPDGRVLIVEDEASRALNIVSFAPNGMLQENPVLDANLVAAFGRELGDLEGLAIGGDGYVYAVGSHSRTKGGERTPAREQLVRFRVNGNEIEDIGFYGGLRDRLLASDVLRDVIAGRTGRDDIPEEIDIEGLAFDATGSSLLVGFRKPLVEGLSLVVTIDNPGEIFANRDAPQISEAALLDLAGGGIRSLDYDPALGGYLIANEVIDVRGDSTPRLWLWSGTTGAPVEEMHFPGLADQKNVESVDAIIVDGQSRLLVTSDDGNDSKARPATYLMLEHDQVWRVSSPSAATAAD